MPLNTVKIGKIFVTWYLQRRPMEITRAYLSYASAFGAMFSFIFLLKTLFAPWKSIRDDYPTKGFNLTAIMEAFTLNVTARGIGFVIRIVAIIVGLLLQIALIAGFSIYLLLWMLFPIIFVFSLPFLLYISF